MKRITKFLILIIFILTIVPKVNAAVPPTTIYKTRTNYNNLVPIGLSEDKSEIVSCPEPSDVYYMGQLAYPTELNQGYLLDNRELDQTVHF